MKTLYWLQAVQIKSKGHRFLYIILWHSWDGKLEDEQKVDLWGTVEQIRNGTAIFQHIRSHTYHIRESLFGLGLRSCIISWIFPHPCLLRSLTCIFTLRRNRTRISIKSTCFRMTKRARISIRSCFRTTKHVYKQHSGNLSAETCQVEDAYVFT